MSEKVVIPEKITPEQAQYVRVKAIKNIARSMIKRAENLGTTHVDGKLVNVTKTSHSTGKEYVVGSNNRPLYQRYRSTSTSVDQDSRVLKVQGFDYPSRSDSTTIADINNQSSKIHLNMANPNASSLSERGYRIAIDPVTERVSGVHLGGGRSGGRIADSELTGKILDSLREQREVLANAERDADNTGSNLESAHEE